MNYNEYDSNGNKKKIDFSDMITDKTQRARLILFVSFALIILLVISIRNNKNDLNTEKEITNEKKEENIVQEEISENKFEEQFSDLMTNNYNFDFNLIYDGISYKSTGKRYNDKYSYVLTNKEDKRLFLGTVDIMKSKLNDEKEYKETPFLYAYINYFDNKVLVDILNKSAFVLDHYEISNSDLMEIIDLRMNKKLNSDLKNSIDLILKNNKIIEIDIDFSNFVSEIENKKISAKVELKYSNFNKIEDFSTEIN